MRNRNIKVLGGVAALVVAIAVLAITVGDSGKTVTTLTPAENGTYTLLGKGSSAIIEGGGNCVARVKYVGTAESGKWVKMTGLAPNIYHSHDFRFAADSTWSIFCDRGEFARLTAVEREGKPNLVKVELLAISQSPAVVSNPETAPTCPDPIVSVTPAPTSEDRTVVIANNNDLDELLITGDMLPPRIDSEGWPWIRVLLGGGVYEFPVNVRNDGTQLYEIAEALDGEDVEVTVTTDFVAALQLNLASDNGNKLIWSSEGGGLSDFGWELYYAATAPKPTLQSTEYLVDRYDHQTMVNGNGDTEHMFKFYWNERTEPNVEYTIINGGEELVQILEAARVDYNGWVYLITVNEYGTPINIKRVVYPFTGATTEQVLIWDSWRWVEYAESVLRPTATAITTTIAVTTTVPEVFADLEVAVIDGTRFFNMANLWAQIDAPANTLEWLSFGVLDGTDYWSGEPCHDPAAVQAGVINDGVRSFYVCLSPGQWARVELRKVEYDGSAPLGVVVGSFYWAPGNPAGQRSTNVEPPTTPVATFVFDADAGTYDIR